MNESLPEGVYWILAWDETKKEYVFGTNPKMLQEGGLDGMKDLDRFRQCDLKRYPSGAKTGFNNEVTSFRTLKEGGMPYSTSANRALEIYKRGKMEVESEAGRKIWVYAEVIAQV